MSPGRQRYEKGVHESLARFSEMKPREIAKHVEQQLLGGFPAESDAITALLLCRALAGRVMELETQLNNILGDHR